MTSEKMNQIMPMRNERSTARLYRPPWFSPITVRNQRKNIAAISIVPGRNDQAPDHSLRYDAAPSTVLNSATDPRIGQPLPCGT